MDEKICLLEATYLSAIAAAGDCGSCSAAGADLSKFEPFRSVKFAAPASTRGMIVAAALVKQGAFSNVHTRTEYSEVVENMTRPRWDQRLSERESDQWLGNNSRLSSDRTFAASYTEPERDSFQQDRYPGQDRAKKNPKNPAHRICSFALCRRLAFFGDTK